ncbi:hypothetical protein MBLNU459_g5208t1 [Dothideomycetes sp. NU459]
MSSAADIPLLIQSENVRSERRISPAWSIAQLKVKLEPITGIPASSQKVSIKIASLPAQALEAADEETTQLSSFMLQAYAEINVIDTRPASARTNYTDTSSVKKYEMPVAEYEALPSTVLSYKRAHQIGRFDPAAPSIESQKIAASFREVAERDITLGARCRLLPADSDGRRGQVAFVGEVAEIPGLGAWVGVTLDEPTGKNDGSVKGTRYFEAGANFGVFVRAERVEVGDFEVEGLGSDEEF